MTNNIDNQQIDEEVHAIDGTEEINCEITNGSGYYLQYCQNYFRKKHLVCDINSNKSCYNSVSVTFL